MMKCKFCNNQTDNTSGICYGHGSNDATLIIQTDGKFEYSNYQNMNPHELERATIDAYHMRRNDGLEISKEVQRRRELVCT